MTTTRKGETMTTETIPCFDCQAPAAPGTHPSLTGEASCETCLEAWCNICDGPSAAPKREGICEDCWLGRRDG